MKENEIRACPRYGHTLLQVDKKVKYLWPETMKPTHEATEETVHDLALPPF